jgi:hypothetical protein
LSQELVISFIQGELTENAQETWIKSRMSHSQLFALKEEVTKKKIPEELQKFVKTVFSERPIGTLPKRRSYDHKIDLKPDFIPKVGAIYCSGRQHDEALQTFIKENLDKGFIQPSESPQAASFFFVPKKGTEVRPVQDYRYLNTGTIRNAYPLPRIDDIIDSLVRKKLFTKMDI